jgi:hypothetical protein
METIVNVSEINYLIKENSSINNLIQEDSQIKE